MTTIYLIRHSVRMPKDSVINYNTEQSDLIKSEKICLSVLGEQRAKILCSKDELKNMDVVYASNCVRTVQTAKYLIESQQLKFSIDERLDERRVGEKNDKEMPNWFQYQFENQDYKTKNGESVNDVKARVNEVIEGILEEHKGKRIAVFSHAMAIIYYLTKFCEVVSASHEVYGNKVVLKFNGEIVIDEPLNAPQIVKLCFDDDSILQSIEKIDYDDLKYMKGL